jgi:hypothetical protein
MANIFENNTGSTVSPTNSTSTSNSSSKIVRIFEDPTIKKKIKLDELSIVNMSKEDSSGGDVGGQRSTGQANTAATVGRSYPLICINDYIIKPIEIVSCVISTISFLPTISLDLYFTNKVFIDKHLPKDGDIISVFVRGSNDVIRSIRNDYVVRGISVREAASAAPTVSIKGELFVPGYTSDKATFGFIGTTKDALRDVASRLEIGFATNDEEETDDCQTWLCCANSYETYIDNIINHVWKDSTSFYKAWVDPYYNLNFINVNKFLLQPELIDITAFNSAVDMEAQFPSDSSQSVALMFPKLFSNMPFMQQSTLYIKSWDVVNQSTAITYKIGTDCITDTFVHNENLLNAGSDPVQKLSNVPTYNPDKTDVCIVLRGRCKYDASNASSSGLAKANYNYKDLYVKKAYTGIEYAMNDDDKNNTDSNKTWSGNVHKNYNRSVYHNMINNLELNKMYIKLTVRGLCTEVMRGELVPVIVNYYSPNQSLENTTNNNPDMDMYNINKFYSGYYVVDGIKYIFDNMAKHSKFTKSSISSFTTELILKRREWPIPEDWSK